METVGGLLLMLIGVSHGVEVYCDGRQDGSQCYGALGEAMVIHLVDNNTKIPRFSWQKNNTVLLLWKNKKIVSDTMGNRSFFAHSSGSTRITNLTRNDSGEYKLETFDSNGKRSGTRTLHLFVQTPVSSVQLVSECLSEGQVKVSCSSKKGDSPQYSWTLDGHTLTDSELLSESNETNVIVLRQNVSGCLICSVRNHISNGSKETCISTCGFLYINCTSNGTQILKWVFKENNTLCVEPTTVSTMEQWSIMAAFLSALISFFIIFIVITCNRRKTIYRVEQEHDQEPTYADIGIVQQQNRQEEQSVKEEESDAEVEYKQVKISKPPCQSEAAVEDLYAKICKVR